MRRRSGQTSKCLWKCFRDLTIHSILGDLFDNFKAEGERNPAVQTKMNQGLFYQTETLLKEDFTKYAKEFYSNELIPLNFSSADDGAAKLINE